MMTGYTNDISSFPTPSSGAILNTNTPFVPFWSQVSPYVPQLTHLPQLTQVYQVYSVVPLGTNVTVYDKGGFTNEKQPVVGNGVLKPAEGFSFVLFLNKQDVEPFLNSAHEQSLKTLPQPVQQLEEPSKTQQLPFQPLSENIEERRTQGQTRQGKTKKPFSKKDEKDKIKVKTKDPKKRKHREKQDKIHEVHSQMSEEYKDILLTDSDEVLRGANTLRVHVKTWDGLERVQKLMEEVTEKTMVTRIDLPFSMKNPHQKKGFILYIQFGNLDDVPIAQEIFAKAGDAFKKVDVAKPSEKSKQKAAQKKQMALRTKQDVSGTTSKREAGQTIDFAPIRLRRRTSLPIHRQTSAGAAP